MNAQTERERMLAGELYWAADPELQAARQRARRLCREFNATLEDDVSRRGELLAELFAQLGPGAEIEPPFRCDYGSHIRAGKKLYVNFGCVILDCCQVTLGDNVLIGPGVHIYAATHPVDPQTRLTGRESAAPVTIGHNVWIGGRAVICPGVTIGSHSTIGAGSVVTRNIPPCSVAVGNPCRVVRTVTAPI